MENFLNSKITLIHEHVFNLYPSTQKEINTSFTLDLLNKLVPYNVGCIVDLTPYANINKYMDIIKSSPITIICCIGFSYGKHVSAQDRRKSVNELFQKMEYSYLNGMGKAKICPQIIKIATNTCDLKEYEKRFAQAAILLSNKYFLPIAYHCPFNTYINYQRLLGLGLNSEKLMVCHYENQYSKMEKSVFLKQAIEMIKKGSYLQFNDFGTKTDSLKAQRITDLLNHIIENGFSENVLLSSDCNWTWKKGLPQMKKGNKNLGYRYLFDYTIPLLTKSGINIKIIERILTENPKRFLSIS